MLDCDEIFWTWFVSSLWIYVWMPDGKFHRYEIMFDASSE
jgi:hypothetical protein